VQYKRYSHVLWTCLCTNIFISEISTYLLNTTILKGIVVFFVSTILFIFTSIVTYINGVHIFVYGIHVVSHRNYLLLSSMDKPNFSPGCRSPPVFSFISHLQNDDWR